MSKYKKKKLHEHNHFKNKVHIASMISHKWQCLITIFLGMAERHQLLRQKFSKHAIIVVTRGKEKL